MKWSSASSGGGKFLEVFSDNMIKGVCHRYLVRWDGGACEYMVSGGQWTPAPDKNAAKGLCEEHFAALT